MASKRIWKDEKRKKLNNQKKRQFGQFKHRKKNLILLLLMSMKKINQIKQSQRKPQECQETGFLRWYFNGKGLDRSKETTKERKDTIRRRGGIIKIKNALQGPQIT